MATERRANPFSEADVPELMKREILFWSHKLQVSPSKLFALSEQELDERLRIVQENQAEEKRREQRNNRIKKLSYMKRAIIETCLDRARMLEKRSIRQVLSEAAAEIERVLLIQNGLGENSSKTGTESSAEVLSKEDVSELNKKEILYWSEELGVTPSTLLSWTEQELNEHLRGIQATEYLEEQRQNRKNRLQKLAGVKLSIDNNSAERERGGSDSRNIWEILAQAAEEIERNYRIKSGLEHDLPENDVQRNYISSTNPNRDSKYGYKLQANIDHSHRSNSPSTSSHRREIPFNFEENTCESHPSTSNNGGYFSTSTTNPVDRK